VNEIPGVQYLAPPTIEMEETIKQHVEPFMASVPEGKHGGVFGVITEDHRGQKVMNAIVAVKVKDTLEIAGYIGKSWSEKPVVWGIETKFYF
jgi:hypothetical protein